MKKLLLVSFFSVILFVLLPYLSFAEEPKSLTPQVTKEQRTYIIPTKIEEHTEKVTTRLETHKTNVLERIGDRKERIASREAALKEKLQTFKDKTKAARVERINKELATINKKQTDAWLEVLTRMTSILTRLQERVTIAKGNGKDMTAVQKTIDDATTAFVSAQTAVATQATNDYTISVTDEEKVIEDAKTTRNTLRNDLETTHEAIVYTREKMLIAIKTALAAMITSDNKNASTAGEKTNGQ